MKTLKNERGMTLVVVLLTIVVFSVLGLAVISTSVSNVKQVSKAESNIKTTDIAEMGIQYYETQLKAYLNGQLYNIEKQNELMNSLYNGTISKDNLITNFKDRYPIELNNAYKSNTSLFTTSSDYFLEEKTVDANSFFKIKINPNGIIKTSCVVGMPSNSECFSISFESYGYYNHEPEKKISATYNFSYTINPESIEIVPSVPILVPLHENLINLIEEKNLRQCTTADFGKNYTTVDCSTNLAPENIPETNGISNSFIVFNNGVNFDHLSHAISGSTIFIYSLDKTTPSEIGKFNPNGFIGSQIVIVGDAKLYDEIMKPVNSSIHITGDADLTGFTFKNSDGLTKVCVKGTITPLEKRSIPGVYSYTYNPTTYRDNCMESEKTVGIKSLTIKSQIISPRISDKSKVTY
ncbi:hypothetical protein AB7942_07980 [Neobacillus sp. BF23-41]|uniref:hypothetical protein n=1 Tax=Neobacillus sp. BF23-41 TaxID=3240280 RepID=UPI0034E61B15